MTLTERAKKVGLDPESFDDVDKLEKAVEEKEKEEKEEKEKEIARKKKEEDDKKDLDYWRTEATKAFDARDGAKAERNKVRDKVKELEKEINESPDADELKRAKEELEELKEFKREIDEEKEEEDFKNKTELERQKLGFEKEFDALKKKWTDTQDNLEKAAGDKDKELETKDEEIVELRKVRLKNEILEAANKFKAFNPSQIVNLVKDEFRYFKDLDKFSKEIRDEKGKLTDELSVSETIEKYLTDPINENLVKSDLPPGGGSDHDLDESHRQFDIAKKKNFGNYDPKDKDLQADADLKGLKTEDLIEINKKRDAKLRPEKKD